MTAMENEYPTLPLHAAVGVTADMSPQGNIN